MAVLERPQRVRSHDSLKARLLGVCYDDSPPAGSCLERHLGTDFQLCFSCLVVAQTLELWKTLAEVHQHPATGPTTGTVSEVVSVVSAILNVVSSSFFLYATHPTRVLLNAGYDGGRSRETPKTFWGRHFGTPLLVAAQLQLLAVAVYLVAGAANFAMAAFEQGREAAEADMAGCNNIVAGFLGCAAVWFLNRSTYPERLTNFESSLAGLIQFVGDRLGWSRRHSRLLQFRVSDNALVGGLMTSASGIWLAGSLADGPWHFRVVTPALYFVSSVAFSRFATNEGSVFDGVLFGCYCNDGTEIVHPMGPLFGGDATKVNPEASLDAALGVLSLPWKRKDADSWYFEGEGVYGMKVELEVDLHPFALAALLESVEGKQTDLSVLHASVVLTLDAKARIMHVESRAVAPMPRSDQVVCIASRETPSELVIAEWAVEHPLIPPSRRVVRDRPFSLYILKPEGVDRTHCTACVFTCVASFMPLCLVRDEMEKALAGLKDLQELPHSSEGTELLAMVRSEVWKAVAQETPPCTWDFIRSSALETKKVQAVGPLAPLSLACMREDPRANPLYTLGALGDGDPWYTVAAALAWCEDPDSWKERSRGLLACRRKSLDGEVRVWTHRNVSTAVKVSGFVPQVHPMALALLISSPEFKREMDPAILELREVQRLSPMRSVWYQRNQHSWPLHHRDAVSTLLMVDLSAERVLVVEWPTRHDDCPEVPGVRRMQTFVLWDLQRAKASAWGRPGVEVTLTVIAEVGGLLGFAPRSSVEKSLGSGMAQLATFLAGEEGRTALREVQQKVLAEVCQAMKASCSPMQWGFMMAHSDTVQRAMIG